MLQPQFAAAANKVRITLEDLEKMLKTYYDSKPWVPNWAIRMSNKVVDGLQDLFNEASKADQIDPDIFHVNVMLVCLRRLKFEDTAQAVHTAVCLKLETLKAEKSAEFLSTLEDYFLSYGRSRRFTKGTGEALLPMLGIVQASQQARPVEDEEKAPEPEYLQSWDARSTASTRFSVDSQDSRASSAVEIRSFADGGSTTDKLLALRIFFKAYRKGFSTYEGADLERARIATFFSIFGYFFPVLEVLISLPEGERSNLIGAIDEEQAAENRPKKLYRDLVLSLVDRGPRVTLKDECFSDDVLRKDFKLESRWDEIEARRKSLKEDNIILADSFKEFYVKKYRASVMRQMIASPNDLNTGFLVFSQELKSKLERFLIDMRPPKPRSAMRRTQRRSGSLPGDGSVALHKASHGSSGLFKPVDRQPPVAPPESELQVTQVISVPGGAHTKQ